MVGCLRFFLCSSVEKYKKELFLSYGPGGEMGQIARRRVREKEERLLFRNKRREGKITGPYNCVGKGEEGYASQHKGLPRQQQRRRGEGTEVIFKEENHVPLPSHRLFHTVLKLSPKESKGPNGRPQISHLWPSSLSRCGQEGRFL